MARYFNTTGACNPKIHYMVDIQDKLVKIKELVDKGAYFTINRTHQYGKTTTLHALKRYLSEEYKVISLDFELFSQSSFESERNFVSSFADELLYVGNFSEETNAQLNEFALLQNERCNLRTLFRCLSKYCADSEKPIVLMIDEVDSATNNQVFLDFLAQLRGYYLHRDETSTFQSVILVGVYDIRNIKKKISPKEDKKTNSPWNIASDFLVDMNFSLEGIKGMVADYENDHHTGMDVDEIANLIYEYTSGYPFLVSRLCQLMERNATWTKKSFFDAVENLLIEKNTLFESLTEKLNSYPDLRKMIYSLLIRGEKVTYNPNHNGMDIATMLGFVKNEQGKMVMSNRLFKMHIYNLFLSEDEINSKIFLEGSIDKNQFIQDNSLNMELVLEKFVGHWNDLYETDDKKFLEENGRKFFLMYLKTIINDVGGYYIESQAQDTKQTDVIVNCLGEKYIIVLKLWEGNSYNEREEAELINYLSEYHLQKGYMLSFNFNKEKEMGVHKIRFRNQILVEAVV